MIVELRRYNIRPGCLDSMHRRMREVLLPLFSAHDVPSPFAIWTSELPTGPAVMTWMLNWPSLEARNATWSEFQPVWESAKANQAEKEFVIRTDLTLIAPWPGHEMSFPSSPSASETAWIVQPRVGYGAAFRRACASVRFPSFIAAGATSVAAADFVFGPLPQSLILISWPDAETRGRGMNQITQLPGGARPEPSDALGATLAGVGTLERFNRVPYLLTWQLHDSALGNLKSA